MRMNIGPTDVCNYVTKWAYSTVGSAGGTLNPLVVGSNPARPSKLIGAVGSEHSYRLFFKLLIEGDIVNVNASVSK